jgi:hypothetical protein
VRDEPEGHCERSDHPDGAATGAHAGAAVSDVSVDVRAASHGLGRDRRPVAGAVEADRPRRASALQVAGVVVLLGFLAIVVPVVVAERYDALGIPRSDDWSYLLTLFRWVDTGHLSFNGWVSMTLVGQVVLAAPFVAIGGRDITTIQLFTAVLGLVGLLAIVFVGRQMLRPAWWAVFVAVTIAVGPLWGPLAPTFMTDIPMLTFQMLTIAAAVMAFRRRPLSIGWFATSIVLGFVGVTIRQYAVVTVIAIVLVAAGMAWADRDWKRLRTVLVIAGCCAVATIGFLYWWSGLPDSKSLSPTMPNLRDVRTTVIKDAGFLRLVALLISPVVVLAGPVRIVRRAWAASRNLTAVVATLTAIWLAATYWRVPKTPFVGAYLTRDGVLSLFVMGGNRADVIPSWMYDLLVVVGSLAGIVLALAIVPFLVALPARIRSRELFEMRDPLGAMLALTIAGFGAIYTVAVLVGLPVYDRYALPFVPVTALLLLHSTRSEPAVERSSRTRVGWAMVAVLLLAFIGLAYTVESASFDGTRWKLAEKVERQGYAPTMIGGGAEWLGYHRQHGPVFDADPTASGRGRFARPCVGIVIDPKNPGPRVIATMESTALTRKPMPIVARRNKNPCVVRR